MAQLYVENKERCVDMGWGDEKCKKSKNFPSSYCKAKDNVGKGERGQVAIYVDDLGGKS